MKLKWLSYLLLCAFSVLFTPKDWWHEHDEHPMCIENHDEASIHCVDDDCFVCDFVLQPATVPFTFIFNFPSSCPVVKVQSDIQFIYCSEFPIQSLRGPPSVFNS